MVADGFLRFSKIRTRLLLLVIILIIANICTSWYLLGFVKGQKENVELLRQSGKSIRYAAEANVNIVNAMSSVYKVINEPKATWHLESKNIESLLQNAKLAFEEYGCVLLTEEAMNRYDSTAEIFNRWLTAMNAINEMIAKEASESEVLNEVNKIYIDTNMLTGSINETFAFAALDMDLTADSISQAIDSATKRSIAIVVVAAVVALLFGFMLTRSINLPLKNMVSFVNSIADDLDLSKEIESAGEDEIGDVLKAIGKLLSRFKEALVVVINTSRNLALSSDDFSASAEEASHIMEGGRKEVDQVSSDVLFLASAVEEISASSQEVAAGAQSAAKRSTDVAEQVEIARQFAQEGIDAVKKAVVSSVEVSDSAKKSVAVVNDLGARARHIQTFVGTIGQIADQTNLLALNAAIEAARAGEHGRGFAVVAEEVRKLAEQSNNAAEQITNLAETIVRDLESVVAATEENAKITERAKEEASNAESAIEKIMHSLETIASAAQDMAAVAEEQAASAEEIASTVQNLSEKSSNLNESVENLLDNIAKVSDVISGVAKGSQDLASLAANLEGQVKVFKLIDELTEEEKISSRNEIMLSEGNYT